MRRNRFAGLMLGLALALALGVAPAAANHTYGVLECGTAGTFDVEDASLEPGTFDAPGPWSGLFLLEGTNQVFRAFYVRTPRSEIVLEAGNRNPNATVECTLTSTGFNFEQPWVLVGQLLP